MKVGNDGRYYYTYEIYINNPNHDLNGHYYYGKHVTKNLEDNYYGSGKLVRQYKSIFGVDGLIKTILAFYDTPRELNQAEQELVSRKKSELGELCCNLHAGGRDGHWVDYVTSEERVRRKEKAIRCLYAKTTPESRKQNAIKAGTVRKKQIAEDRTAWSETVVSIHANRPERQKREMYNKVSESLKSYYSNADAAILAKKRQKNQETNVESAKIWRSEFQNLFKHTPEYFRKFGLQGAALALYKRIRNLSQEVQRHEITRFMESIG